MKSKIFVSYSSQDTPWVREFVHTLKELGVDAWFAEEQIALGDSIYDKIEHALRESNAIILVLSKHSVRSRWTYFEIGAALSSDKKIIPIIVDDVEYAQLPSLVTRYQSLRAQSPQEASKEVAKLFAEPEVATT